MSSGTCSIRVGETNNDRCTRPSGHPGDHFGTVDRQREAVLEPPAQPCGMPDPSGELDCSYPSGHAGTGHQTRDEGGVLHTWYGLLPADPSIPHSVRTRVRLHAAQTEYDLTVLKNRIDCMPTLTAQGKELRRKREQLTAELEAWQYLSKITHTRMD